MDVNKAEAAKYVVQMQNGDGQAFEKLYNLTNQSGYFTALKILKDEDEAQDVLQDSYVKVLEKIREIQNPESFVSWFHQIVANTAKNYLAKKKPSLFTSEEEEQDYAEFTPDEDEIWQPEKSVDEDDMRRQIMQIIEGLTDEKRTCVLLYYYNEMSVSDIARSVGASENTVKARLFQARKDIRKEVEKLGKKNISLRGVAPISLVLWALRVASKAEGAKFAAGPAAAAVMEGAAASAGVAAATAAGGTAAVTAGGGLAAKIAAMTVAQKVIAGVVTTAVVAGAATGASAIVKHTKDEPETTTEAVEAFAEVTTADLLESMISFTEAEETTTQPDVPQTEPVTEPTATTATSTATTTVYAPPVTVQRTAAPTTAERTLFTTVAPTTGVGTTKPTTTTATTTAAATTTTTKPTTPTTTAPSGAAPQTTAATTAAITTKPTTTTTTEKPKGTATVNVKYAVADHADSGTVTFTVEEGSPITEELVESKVLAELEGRYEGTLIVSPFASINVASAEATTYTFTVDVFVF